MIRVLVVMTNETYVAIYDPWYPGKEFDVVKLAVSPSGKNHRLETASGKKFIIPPVFLSIEIDADYWSL